MAPQGKSRRRPVLPPAEVEQVPARRRSRRSSNRQKPRQRGSFAGSSELHQSAKKKVKKDRLALGNGAEPPPLALGNGGHGDGINMSGAYSAGKGKGKGKQDDKHDGKPICYNWNKDKACTKTPCGFAHVCLICKKDHPACRHEA